MRPALTAPAAALAAVLVAGLAACGDGETSAAPTTTPVTTTSTTTTAPPTTTTTTRPPTATTTTAAPTTTRATTPTATRAPVTTTPPAPKPAGPPSLKGDTRNAWAFAPVSNPSAITIEGSVTSFKAWSTSKVLVVAAFLDTAAGGDPNRVSASNRSLITKALTASDMNAVIAIRDQIPGSPGAAINRVLREIGDTTTYAPDTSQGGMQWNIREQVRFMAAMAAGRVVSPATSAYLLSVMHPIPQHSWGLGTVGASSYKGGWLTSQTVTRQMGILDGYAVAIITQAVGPAVLQTDGDSAHVQQMNVLAKALKTRLASQR